MTKPAAKKESVSPAGYELKKVNFIKGGGVKATFVETVIKDDVVNKIQKIIDNPIPKHPDLDRTLTPLKLHIARVYGYLEGIEKQSEEKVTNTITITGITFSGDEGSTTEGVLISGNKEVLGGERVVAINTPNIILEEDIYSHGKDLATHIKAVRAEVEEYLFNQKYSQLSLFGGDDKEEEEKKDLKVA